MGRAPCCSKVGLHRGPWTPREDTLLINYIQAHGEGNWRSLPKKAGLLRCGKSCRLRWMNYLRPDIKRGNITPDEDDLIIRMHSLLGNRWSLIAGRLPGRTDNEIKNYWNTHLCKKLRIQGTDPNSYKKLSDTILQQTKKKKIRKKNSNNNNNEKTMKGKDKNDPEKPKIHLPKPVRFSYLSLPRNDSFESSSLCSSREGEGGGSTVIPVTAKNWYNFNDEEDHGISFLVGDVDHDFLNVPAHDDDLVLTENNNLEKLCDEYLQLLTTDDHDQFKLDSFAKSLLM